MQQHRFPLRFAVLLASIASIHANVEDYPISPAGSQCVVRMLAPARALAAQPFPLSYSDAEIHAVTLQLVVLNTGWAPVQSPWVLSLVNPGYHGAYNMAGFELANNVDYG